MLNQFVVVGRMASDPEIKETENGMKVCYITLGVPRNFKNNEGECDTDYIDIVLWNNLAENTTQYVKKGDLVGIKGRVQSYDKDDVRHLEIVAEKVTFLATKKEEKDETTND